MRTDRLQKNIVGRDKHCWDLLFIFAFVIEVKMLFIALHTNLLYAGTSVASAYTHTYTHGAREAFSVIKYTLSTFFQNKWNGVLYLFLRNAVCLK